MTTAARASTPPSPRAGRRRVAGAYQQSGGARCTHNHVQGIEATRFVLACVRERLLTPRRLEKLEAKLTELAEAEQGHGVDHIDETRLRGQIADIEALLPRVKQNLARARNDAEYEAVAEELGRLQNQREALEQQITTLPARGEPKSVEEEVGKALRLVQDLESLSADPDNLEALRLLFDRVNARLFASFRPVREGKRTLNRLVGGVLTFGDTPPPVPIYEGPMARSRIPKVAKGPNHQSLTASEDMTGPEGGSLGNVNRGDRI